MFFETLTGACFGGNLIKNSLGNILKKRVCYPDRLCRPDGRCYPSGCQGCVPGLPCGPECEPDPCAPYKCNPDCDPNICNPDRCSPEECSPNKNAISSIGMNLKSVL